MSVAEALSGKDTIKLDDPQIPPCKKQCFDPSWMKEFEGISRSYESTFTEELLIECKKHNLHTLGVVCGCGLCVPKANLKKLAPMVKESPGTSSLYRNGFWKFRRTCTYAYQSCVREHHVFKETWTPSVEKQATDTIPLL